MSRRTRLSLGVVAVAGAVGAVLVPAASALAVAPTFAATPSSSLFNGDSVTLSGAGYTPGETLNALECNGATFLTYLSAHPGDTTGAAVAACDVSNIVPITADLTTGAIPDGTVMTVKSGQLGSDATSVCDYTTNTQCVIGVADATTNTQLGQQPIAFSQVTATPASSLKNGQTIQVSGLGLPALTNVSLVECNQAHTDASGSGCNLGGLTSGGQTDATGAMASHSFVVKTGQLGSNPLGVCSYSTNGQCAVAVIDSTTLKPYGGAILTFAQTYTKRTVTVTLASSDTTVKTGQTFHLKGRTKVGTAGVNNLTVKLYKKAPSATTWTLVATKKTSTINGVRGSYNFSQLGMKHNEDYRVVHPKQTIGLNIYLADASPTILEKHVT